VVSNLYVRQANLKVILELTGSQCSSERRAVAEWPVIVKGWVRLHEQLRFTHVVIFNVGETVDKRVCIVDMYVDKGSSCCLSHVVW